MSHKPAGNESPSSRHCTTTWLLCVTRGAMLGRIIGAPLKAIRLFGQLRRQEGGRQALSYLKRLGFRHESAVQVTRLIKVSLSPIQATRRMNVQTAKNVVRIPRDTGVLKVPNDLLDDAAAIVAHCSKVFESKHQALIADFKPPYAQAINFVPSHSGIRMADPEEVRPILNFMAQPCLFDMMAEYIGELPALSNVALVFTQPTQERIGPQLFHRDRNARRQLHLIMPIWPVTPESGPFTLLPANLSDKVVRAMDNDESRIPDALMFEHCSREELIPLAGDPGDVFLCNPGKCFHYGARATCRPRLMLIANVSSPFEGAEGLASVYRSTNRHLLDSDDWRVRALLNI